MQGSFLVKFLSLPCKTLVKKKVPINQTQYSLRTSKQVLQEDFAISLIKEMKIEKKTRNHNEKK